MSDVPIVGESNLNRFHRELSEAVVDNMARKVDKMMREPLVLNAGAARFRRDNRDLYEKYGLVSGTTVKWKGWAPPTESTRKD